MTAQIHEKLILDGEPTTMAFCPGLPDDHPRVVAVTQEEWERMLASGRPYGSTACWRRYIGTWEVKKGRFYLVGLEGVMRLDGDAPLLADWFTGVLCIPRGEMLQYVHMGFASIYERELHVQIERGMVIGCHEIGHRGQDRDEHDLSWANPSDGEIRLAGDEEV